MRKNLGLLIIILAFQLSENAFALSSITFTCSTDPNSVEIKILDDKGLEHETVETASCETVSNKGIHFEMKFSRNGMDKFNPFVKEKDGRSYFNINCFGNIADFERKSDVEDYFSGHTFRFSFIAGISFRVLTNKSVKKMSTEINPLDRRERRPYRFCIVRDPIKNYWKSGIGIFLSKQNMEVNTSNINALKELSFLEGRKKDGAVSKVKNGEKNGEVASIVDSILGEKKL